MAWVFSMKSLCMIVINHCKIYEQAPINDLRNNHWKKGKEVFC